MIRSDFSVVVNGRRWGITVFVPVTRYHVEEILDTLLSIGMNEDNYKDTVENLTSGRVNNGITFSNPYLRRSVSVWACSTSPAQYFNLIVHELHHLSVHIASMNGMDLEGEGVCYLSGDIAEILYPLCKRLIC